MNADVECPLCGGANHDIQYTGVRFAEDVNVHVCGDCQMVYLWPQPDELRLNAFYTHEYRSVYDDPTPAERHDADMPEAEQRVGRLMPFLAKDTRVLEIGSGSCAFLERVAPHIHEAVGVEMDQESRDWYASVADTRVFHTLADVPNEQNFDLIVLFHVLEHLPDPVVFMSQLAERLKAGGRIVVEVPNVDDALLSLYKVEGFAEFYYSIAHLTYFSPKTLTACADAAMLGGEVVGIQRYDLSNHLFWALNNKPGGQAAFAKTISAETAASYAQDLVDAGQADTLWGVFQRCE